MRRSHWAPVFLSCLAMAGCQSIKTGPPEQVAVISGFSSPESVIASPEGRVFVSNVGEKLEPTLKDGDGYISELGPEGRVVNRRFLPKSGVLNAPKGMAITGNVLYAADIDRVVGFDLTSGEKVFEMDFSPEKTVFLNDLALYDANTLFLSATDAGKVYRIDIAARTFTVLRDNLPGANGLYYDREGERLFVVTFGEGTKFNGEAGVIDLKTNEYKRLAGPLGALDGVALLPGGRLLFSDWVEFGKPGLLRTYDLGTGELSVYRTSEDIAGPADFMYDAKKGLLWIPKMMEGKVLIERVK